ncbi:MAG: hypothetical protein WA208_02165 [Thermoanaerobaculia bacterium]
MPNEKAGPLTLKFKTERDAALYQQRAGVKLFSDEELERILSNEPDGKAIVGRTSRCSPATSPVQTQPSTGSDDVGGVIERWLAEEYGDRSVNDHSDDTAARPVGIGKGSPTAPRPAAEALSALVDRWVTEEFVQRGYPAETQKMKPKPEPEVSKKAVALHRAEMVEAGTSVMLGGIFSLMLVLWVPIVVAMIIIGLVTQPMYMIPSLVLIYFFGGLRKSTKA